MKYWFQLKFPFIFIGGMVWLFCLAWYLWKYKKNIRYRYSRVSQFFTKIKTKAWGKYILRLVRFAALSLLVFIIARPQLVDTTSKKHIDGIDIMLVLDVSNSMMLFDDLSDRRSRIVIAKAEAIKFVEKRPDDQIGLVIFGRDAVSRCPLTYDKHLIQDIITKLELGVINPDGTVLSRAIVVAANRLKTSKAKSKIMILLTDGEPTQGLDLPPSQAVDIAQQLGIKIYTIGIGGEHGGLIEDPIFGVQAMGFHLNQKLLESIAKSTGGKSFEAKNSKDLEKIYGIIDSLEKTEYETTIFSNYYDIFIPFLAFALLLMLVEVFFSTWIWFSIE
jgi:Ca-activated chloride channel homolog